MNVLGIESSCDETAAAVVADGRRILSNTISSSLDFHKKYGGIVPEIAFRMQLETITQVADCALKDSNTPLKNIGLISVTCGPGLLGSLLVGISFAKAISLAKNIPILGVNHLYSHIYAGLFNHRDLKPPFMALVISGGHTNLFYVRDFDKIEPLGTTQDDACGEAFDKVAKILKLGYPGGPLIENLAKKGNHRRIKFGCSNTKKPLNFSFSGTKTAVLYYTQKNITNPSLAHYKQAVCDICASFQESVINVLIEKSFLACKMKKNHKLVIGGGVAANNRLRDRFYDAAGNNGLKIFFPTEKLCLDNAAMVAGLGYQLFKRGHYSQLDLNAMLD